MSSFRDQRCGRIARNSGLTGMTEKYLIFKKGVTGLRCYICLFVEMVVITDTWFEFPINGSRGNMTELIIMILCVSAVSANAVAKQDSDAGATAAVKSLADCLDPRDDRTIAAVCLGLMRDRSVVSVSVVDAGGSRICAECKEGYTAGGGHIPVERYQSMIPGLNTGFTIYPDMRRSNLPPRVRISMISSCHAT